jgi:hypothetical protein
MQPTIDFKKLDFVIVIQKKVDTEALNFLPLKPDTVEEPKLLPAPPASKKKGDDDDEEEPAKKNKSEVKPPQPEKPADPAPSPAPPGGTP